VTRSSILRRSRATTDRAAMASTNANYKNLHDSDPHRVELLARPHMSNMESGCTTIYSHPRRSRLTHDIGRDIAELHNVLPYIQHYLPCLSVRHQPTRAAKRAAVVGQFRPKLRDGGTQPPPKPVSLRIMHQATVAVVARTCTTIKVFRCLTIDYRRTCPQRIDRSRRPSRQARCSAGRSRAASAPQAGTHG